MAIKGTTKVDFDFDEETRASIEVALAEALNRKSGDITKQIVKAALEERESRGYGSSGESMLQKAIKSAIQAEAREQINNWLLLHREEIRQTVATEVSKLLSPQLVADNVVSVLSKYELLAAGKKGSKTPYDDIEEE